MKTCYCTRCFEEITAPIFIDGKPYGWTCATIVKPGLKKEKVKRNYVVADSFEFIEEKPLSKKCIVSYNGKKYSSLALKDLNKDLWRFFGNEMQFDGTTVYIDLNMFKQKK